MTKRGRAARACEAAGPSSENACGMPPVPIFVRSRAQGPPSLRATNGLEPEAGARGHGTVDALPDEPKPTLLRRCQPDPGPEMLQLKRAQHTNTAP